MKGTTSTARCTDEASTPGPTGTGECGVGVVVGAAQEQATQAAAEREVVGKGLCCQGSLARLRMAGLDGTVWQAVVTVFALVGLFFRAPCP